jgi:hypothetical protein
MNKKLIMLALAVMVSVGQTYASAAARERLREAQMKNAQEQADKAAKRANQANQRKNQVRR